MAQEYLFAVVATDHKDGMPGGGDDPGKGSLAASGGGEWSEGFEIRQGDWRPVGFFVYLHETEQRARDWLTTAAGEAVLAKYDSVNIFRLRNADK
jgi:hypothetical protein